MLMICNFMLMSQLLTRSSGVHNSIYRGGTNHNRKKALLLRD